MSEFRYKLDNTRAFANIAGWKDREILEALLDVLCSMNITVTDELYATLNPLTRDLFVDTRPATPEAPKEPAKFTEDQIRKVKELKEKLGYQKSEQLNPLVAQWTKKPEATFKELTPKNVDEFIAFATKKYFRG